MRWTVPLSDLDYGEAELQAVHRVLESKWLTMGPATERFEDAFAAAVDAPHAVALSSGTAALHLACRAFDIGPGDEVIVPSLTFVATANAVVYCGATPVFADITSEDDWTISAREIERRITDRTAAIIVMHYAGYPCDMAAIVELASRHGIAVIEDCAHAPLAALDDRALGTLGHVGCFSFYANKNLAIGEGGMLVTGDVATAERVRRMRCHGMSSVCAERHRGAGPVYDVTELGYNYRLDEMRAALGLVQLEKTAANNARRRELLAAYRASLGGCDGIRMPFSQWRGTPAHHICPVLLDATLDRQRCIDALYGCGIQTSVHYTPVHTFSYYRQRPGTGKDELPLTELVGAQEVTLPLHVLMTAQDVNTVVQALEAAVLTAARDRGSKPVVVA